MNSKDQKKADQNPHRQPSAKEDRPTDTRTNKNQTTHPKPSNKTFNNEKKFDDRSKPGKKNEVKLDQATGSSAKVAEKQSEEGSRSNQGEVCMILEV